MLALAGCGGTDPRTTIARAFGPSTEGRDAPPGLEEGTPYPAIGSVPARPTRPDAALRLALTERLARERAVSRIEVPVAASAREPVGAGGGLPGPPERPRLGPSVVAGPPVPNAPALPTAPTPRGAAPEAPPADMLAPGAPALPGSDLLAPPRLP
ncbi:hypothetical protein [Plastoroseomonas arctica]|uniref:Uncharacterized protein n=1 Tax=Plastoroseomonas arctica TaxID=1509237 RepID=A0AAF1JU22_9PROT|nr:hypothetical protein [Plastoroseomonas arctica]MBR0653635.1 hypothetical protein [Plastoroseomonas arctica]